MDKIKLILRRAIKDTKHLTLGEQYKQARSVLVGHECLTNKFLPREEFKKYEDYIIKNLLGEVSDDT